MVSKCRFSQNFPFPFYFIIREPNVLDVYNIQSKIIVKLLSTYLPRLSLKKNYKIIDVQKLANSSKFIK